MLLGVSPWDSVWLVRMGWMSEPGKVLTCPLLCKLGALPGITSINYKDCSEIRREKVSVPLALAVAVSLPGL